MTLEVSNQGAFKRSRNMKSLLKMSFFAAILLFAARGEASLELSYDGGVFGSSIHVTGDVGSNYGPSGEIYMKILSADGGDENLFTQNVVNTFCMEPFDDLNFSAMEYSVETLDDVNLKALYGQYYSQIQGDSQKTAAFGLAVWELVWEDSGVWDITNGSGFSSPDVSESVSALVNSWLGNLDISYAAGVELVQLTPENSDKQSLVTVVPEPASLFIMAAGGMGLLMSRKRKSA